MKEKVILAYSGGLDTTAIIPWLKENFDYEVICVCADCGQGDELDGLQERAISCGASKLYIEDLTDEFCDDFIVPCVQAHAVYENKYLLGTSMARPVIAKRLVEIARKEGATAICHGATGKGNDQIRFELTIKALAPDIKIIAAWRNDKWTLKSREDEIEYCRQHGIHLPFSPDSSYSRDRNIWHISHEGLELEDPANEPNYKHLLVLGVTQTFKHLLTHHTIYPLVLWRIAYNRSQISEQRICLRNMCQSLAVVVVVVKYHSCLWTQMLRYMGQQTASTY